MQRNYTRICRVCMAEGSRDIFPRNLTDSSTLGATAAGDGHPIAAPSVTCSTSTSPLDRLLEKLRYVTMMKIDENDDLPRLLCDLCIVQLNVAYNFKRQAVENDTKLRQYFIENGISSSHYNVAPTVSTIRATTRGTFVATPIPTHQHAGSRHIPVIPFVVKSEATETDRLSDITENLEIVGNSPAETQTQLNHSNNTNSSGNHSVNMQNSFGASSEGGTNTSMVYMINGSSGTPSSEVEFIPNPPPSTRNDVVNRNNVANNEESSFIQRLKMGGPSKSSEERSNFEKGSTPQHKKQKLQPSSIDFDIKERMLEAPELKRLAIDSNFQPSDAPRQARILKTPCPGTTHATQTEKETNFVDTIPPRQNGPKKSEKKAKSKIDCPSNKGSKSVKLTNALPKTDSHKMLPNPFTPKITSSEKLLQKIKTVRGKRPPEKIFRPKINPPTTKKINKSTSIK